MANTRKDNTVMAIPRFITTGHIGRGIRRRVELAHRTANFRHLRSLGMTRKQSKDYSRQGV